MRNKITFVFILLSSILYGQEYLNETCKWKIKDLAYVDLYYVNADYHDFVQGDTIIGDSTYFKVYRKGNVISTFTPFDTMFTSEIYAYQGAISEQNKIWYWVQKERTEPTVLYDFNVEDGDSIKYYGSDTKYKLELIDSIYHGGMYRKVFRLGELIINLIEGVGWNTGLLRPIFPYDSFSYLQCFNNQGENLNPDLSGFEMLPNIVIEEFNECGELLSGINGESYRTEIAKIYPNPFEEILTIETKEKIEEVIIINKLGEIIYNEKRHIDNINFGDMASGVYTLLLYTRTGLSTHRVVKL